MSDDELSVATLQVIEDDIRWLADDFVQQLLLRKMPPLLAIAVFGCAVGQLLDRMDGEERENTLENFIDCLRNNENGK